MQAQRVTVSLSEMYNAVGAMENLMDEPLTPGLAMMFMLNIDNLQKFVNASLKVRDKIAKKYADETGKLAKADLAKANEEITLFFQTRKEIELFLISYEELATLNSPIISPKTLANIRFMIYGIPSLNNEVDISFQESDEPDEGGEE